MDLPKETADVSRLPGDFEPSPLGNHNDLIAAIQAVAPMADFSDPSRGQIVTADFVIEVSLGKEEPVDSVMLHVRGGDAAIGLISQIVEQLNARLPETKANPRAYDVQAGELFGQTSAAASLAAWREFRDRVMVTRPDDDYDQL